MKIRRVVAIVITALIVIGVGIFAYIQSLTQLPPLTISYSTVQTEKPADAPCLGGGEGSPGIAKEVLNIQTDEIYVAGGANPIPDDVWATFEFRLPYIQNSTRHLLFTGSCFFRSPGVAADCLGDDCFIQSEFVGYTWYTLNSVTGQVCYPDASGCTGQTVSAGFVSITTIAKCHEISYDGESIYDLGDGRGNRYVMHASADGTPNINDVALPDGWTIEQRAISEPLVLLPFGGGDHCYYNIVRDNLTQSYHQYIYADDMYPAQAG
jgi:hypothetical protein